jgi:hypothetical protein
MTIASFAPTASINLAISTTSANVAIPTTGTPTVALVTNMAERVAYVQMGTSNAVAATTTSLAIEPRESVSLTIGTNTYIAGLALSGVGQLNIAVGT